MSIFYYLAVSVGAESALIVPSIHSFLTFIQYNTDLASHIFFSLNFCLMISTILMLK